MSPSPEPRLDVSPASDYIRGGGGGGGGRSFSDRRTNTHFAGWGSHRVAVGGDQRGAAAAHGTGTGGSVSPSPYSTIIRARSATPTGSSTRQPRPLSGLGLGGGATRRRLRATPSPSPPTPPPIRASSWSPSPSPCPRHVAGAATATATATATAMSPRRRTHLTAVSSSRPGSRASSRPGSRASSRPGSRASSSSSSSSSSKILPDIAAAMASPEDPETTLKREITALADEASRLKAASESRERTLANLTLQLAESDRVAASSTDDRATANLEVLQTTMRCEAAEHDVTVVEARGVSWDALRVRVTSERLASERAASQQREALKMATKEVDDLRSECERASHRAAEAVRRLEDTRDAEHDASEARRRDGERFKTIRASLSMDPERAASLMRDVRRHQQKQQRRRQGNVGGGGGSTRYTVGIKQSGVRNDDYDGDRGVSIGRRRRGEEARTFGVKLDVAEDMVSAAEERILVETGVSSAAEVARRMCGGHDETEAELKEEISETERRIRGLKRQLREIGKERDDVTLRHQSEECEAAAEAEKIAVSSAEAAVETASEAAEEGRAKAARTRERVARAKFGIVNLLESLRPAAQRAAAEAEKRAKEGGNEEEEEEEEEMFNPRASALVKEARASYMKPVKVLSLFGEEGDDDECGEDDLDGEDEEKEKEAVDAADETKAVLRILNDLEKVIDQVSAAATAPSHTETAPSDEEEEKKEEEEEIERKRVPGGLVARAASGTSVPPRSLRQPRMLVARGGGKENVNIVKQQKGPTAAAAADVVVVATTTNTTIANMMMTKEAAPRCVVLDRSATAHNRRVTLNDFYYATGATTETKTTTTTTTQLHENEEGNKNKNKKMSDGLSSTGVNEAHQAARRAMRSQEKTFARAAKNKALLEEEAAAKAARAAARAERIAANKRFGVDVKDDEEEEEEEETSGGGYVPGRIVIPRSRTLRRKHWSESHLENDDSDSDDEKQEDGDVPTRFLRAADRARSSRRGKDLSLGTHQLQRESTGTRASLSLVR